MKLLVVTGSRDWTDREAIVDVIRDEMANLLMHGDCPTGADRIADTVGKLSTLTVVPMPAQWEKHGRSAGPIRNARMADVAVSMRSCGWNVVVHAFMVGESRGTKNAIGQFRANGFAVNVHEGALDR